MYACGNFRNDFNLFMFKTKDFIVIVNFVLDIFREGHICFEEIKREEHLVTGEVSWPENTDICTARA